MHHPRPPILALCVIGLRMHVQLAYLRLLMLLLLLLVLSCCQVILSMAREADPEGSRTLGVLTKPDQVEEGCHGQWLQVLAGER